MKETRKREKKTKYAQRTGNDIFVHKNEHNRITDCVRCSFITSRIVAQPERSPAVNALRHRECSLKKEANGVLFEQSTTRASHETKRDCYQFEQI